MTLQRRISNRISTSPYRSWRIQWNDENCLELIDLYKEKTELWDPDDPLYTSRPAQIAAWKYISRYFLCRMDEVKLTLESLRQKHRSERIREGSSTEVYKSDWFAYDSFDFIRNIGKKRRYTDDFDNDTICQKRDVSHRRIVNINSIRNGYISKGFSEQRNQFSSSTTLARGKTTNRESSSLDEESDVPNYAVSTLVHNECSTFADHVKMKLKKFSLQDQAIIMHKINNIIFEVEMKKYGHRYNVE